MGYQQCHLCSNLLKREDVTVTGDYYGTGNNWTTRTKMQPSIPQVAASYAAPVDQDVTIKGHIPVHFSAAFVEGDKAMPMSVRP